MDWFTGVIVYLMVWWLTLFTVLPWGNDPEDAPEAGNAPSAPAMPRLKLKFLITSGIAAIVWLVVYMLIEIKVIDFYGMSEQMMQDDGL